MVKQNLILFQFFFSSRRRHTRQESVSWARRCVQETGTWVLCGVLHLHSANIVHSDLNPSNIFINQSEVVKICSLDYATSSEKDDYYTQDFIKFSLRLVQGS
eukprot:TRINITY_DN8024_c0_g1_i1.p1 TRINITY_DN8024_c0_g1~~TRINITY_DN8024_c0_g1_i1.p1  ORF type:complete len:102 (+),score=24.25 TRINITY_DN8024_c0_g1_i1:37-342(+)